MDKIVICLYGGPGTGKSTTAAHLFALLKQRGANTELVTEYVKNWVWEGREIKPGDQYYLFAKQSRLERMKFKDVDITITDSPVWLSSIYERKFEPEPHICGALIDKHVGVAKSMGVQHKHVFLKRCKPYDKSGRYQTEEEAKEIDKEIWDYLAEVTDEVVTVTSDNSAAENIIKYLGL